MTSLPPPFPAPPKALSNLPTKVRCAALLFHQNQLLLMQQNGLPFLVFPGGTLEGGESTPTCTGRELWEEVDLTTTLGPLCFVSEFLDGKRQVLELYYLAHYVSGPTTWQPPHPENIDAIAWMSRDAFAAAVVKPASVAAQVLQHWEALAAASHAGEPWPSFSPWPVHQGLHLAEGFVLPA